MTSNLDYHEKRKLNIERQKAVRDAWKIEKNRVLNGIGTRDWSIFEQVQLLERGSISGYVGHHMQSVSLVPEQAGNAMNIQFLTDEEHYNGAHQNNFQNLTNGYFDPVNNTYIDFDDNQIKEVPLINLSDKLMESDSKIFHSFRMKYFQENDQNTNSNELEKSRQQYCEVNSEDILIDCETHRKNLDNNIKVVRK